MKVLDLQCAQRHVFEGWFASEQDYLSQQARSLMCCPMCGDTTVSKRLSAPRLNFGAAPATQAVAAPSVEPVAEDPAVALQQQWLLACRHIVANTVDVGVGFAHEARKIHYGEATERAIRGTASPKETEALLEEGIVVLPLLLPDGLTEPLQ
jgi:hypothetical protein